MQEKYVHDINDKVHHKSALVMESIERKKEEIRARNEYSVKKAKQVDAENEARRVKQALDKVHAKEEKTAKVSEMRQKLL